MELERKWVERTFSKIKEGSLRGSIFTLANTALGVSVFLLPYMLREAGLILGLLIVGLSAFINHLTVTIIAEVADATHTYTYQDLVTNELGLVCGKVLTVAVILYELGTITGFQVISKFQSVGELVPSIADSLAIRADKVLERDVSIAFVIVVIVIPLSFFRKLSKFRFLSLFAICALSYVMVLLIVEAPLFIKKESFKSIEYARGSGSILQVITITLLAYFCHTNVPSIMGELRGTSIRRMRKISLRTSLLLLCLYGAVAFFGYISLLGDTPKVILMRNAGNVIDHDGAMVLGRVLITVMLIIAVPINLHPCRLACCQLVNRSQESLTPIA